MNSIAKKQYPASSEQANQFVELLGRRGINRAEFQRAIDEPEVCDKVADVMRITEIPAVDINQSFDTAGIHRVVNYLFGRSIERAKKYDGEPWFAKGSTGYDPRDLYDEVRFRKLLAGMNPECLTILVMRNGLLDGSKTPAGVLAERYGVPPSYIATLLKRANRHMKVKQVEEFPFFKKWSFRYQDLWEDAESHKDKVIDRYFGDKMYSEVRERVLAAGITTVGELIALPKRQAAELLLGPDVYLPPEWFPR